MPLRLRPLQSEWRLCCPDTCTIVQERGKTFIIETRSGDVKLRLPVELNRIETFLQDAQNDCPDAGLAFRKGDILHVIAQDDMYWWQARIGEYTPLPPHI